MSLLEFLVNQNVQQTQNLSDYSNIVTLEYCFNKHCVINIAVKLNNRVIPKMLRTYIGEDVMFECNSDHNVTWDYNRDALPFNANPSNIPIYKPLHTNKHIYFLIINNVQIYNAGTYSCLGLVRDYYYGPDYENKKYFVDSGTLEVIVLRKYKNGNLFKSS